MTSCVCRNLIKERSLRTRCSGSLSPQHFHLKLGSISLQTLYFLLIMLALALSRSGHKILVVNRHTSDCSNSVEAANAALCVCTSCKIGISRMGGWFRRVSQRMGGWFCRVSQRMGGCFHRVSQRMGGWFRRVSWIQYMHTHYLRLVKFCVACNFQVCAIGESLATCMNHAWVHGIHVIIVS